VVTFNDVAILDLWGTLPAGTRGPLLCLIGGAFVIYLVARLITHQSWLASHNEWLASLTALVFAVALGLLLEIDGASVRDLAQQKLKAGGLAQQEVGRGDIPMLAAPKKIERGAVFIGSVAMGLGLCVAIYSGRYLSLDRRYKTYYPLLLLLVAGLLGMVLATDLFGLYMFCELMSVTAYVLVAFRRRTDTAIEAGFKYLVMGSMGTITLLMGIAFIYRETGTLMLPQTIATPGIWSRAGLACILVGLGIKSAIVPAHTWLPDAHGRAPSSISAMLSGIVIQSALYALLKVSLGVGFPARDMGLLLMILAVLNMTVGNGLALVQIHTKRLLAYSTIAQMGYAMFSIGVGLRYALPAATQAGFFMLLTHTAMKGLAFMSKGVCHYYCHTTLVEELRGTSRQLPLVAATFSIALIGLVGIPPLAGFTGKWFILAEVLRTGDWIVYVGTIIFLLNTILSLGYYLPLIAMLYTPLPSVDVDPSPIAISIWMIVPLVILSLLVIVMGIYPGPWLRWSANVLTFAP
jgi:proton-translocating NADH-quinone oxidoreductase chain N